MACFSISLIFIQNIYKENPKTKGSGIVCAIPQKGICPNKCDDCFFHADNLMFVRFRANTWNKDLQHLAVQYYAEQQTPVVLTFMAYFDTADIIPPDHRENYVFRKRTLNRYWAITTKAWRDIMRWFCAKIVFSKQK